MFRKGNPSLPYYFKEAKLQRGWKLKPVPHQIWNGNSTQRSAPLYLINWIIPYKDLRSGKMPLFGLPSQTLL